MSDLTLNVLIEIRDTLTEHTKQLAGINLRIDTLDARLTKRLDGTNERIDSLIEAHGAGRRDHEDRIAVLENRVGKLEKRPPRKR
jgi:hypothetical protein